MEKHKEIIDFIRLTFEKPSGIIPLHEPRFIGNEKKYLNDCLDSNFVSSIGKYVTIFEKKCAEFTGAKYAIAAMNGTSALHISLILAGVKPEDEVITQALTFIATANAISYSGATPIFLDVDKETMGLSAKAVENWLKKNVELRSSPPQPYNKTTGKRIAACIPMHTFGHSVNLDDLLNICNQFNIPLIEDAAESLGSFYKGKHTGTFGKLGILSFNGNKIITTGGGGMILTNDENLAKKAKHLTTQAKVPHAWEFIHDKIGYNYRLTNINAALGCAQIENLNYFLGLKRKLALTYEAFFLNTRYDFFSEPEHCLSNYWLNAIITKDRDERDELLKYTNLHGIMTRPVWELMNRLPMYIHCQTDNLQNSIWFADRIVNLPSSAIISGY